MSLVTDRNLNVEDPTFSSIEDAIEDIRRGRMIVVADDESRENEGDLLMAAAHATTEAINSFYFKPPAMLGRTKVAVALHKATESLGALLNRRCPRSLALWPCGGLYPNDGLMF